MADIQRVSCNAMRSDSEALSQVLRELPQAIEQMQVAMRNLARCWEGPAWEAFQTQVNRDIQNMQDVYQCLAGIQAGLGKGREIYLRAEYDVYTDIKLLWI